MNTRQRKSNTKRQYKNDESQSGKRQRIESPPPNKEVPATKITDLDDDCLEKIFMPLDLENMLNVTLSNKWLGSAANVVYKRKFGASNVCLHSVRNTRNSSIVCQANTIVIRNFKVCLQFLRCFGSSITNLEIYYGHSKNKRYDYVHKYVNEYCAGSVSDIRLYFKPSFAIKNFKKPFVKVQNVQMYGCDLGERFLPFAKWFPNVSHLNIHGFGLKHRFISAPPTQLEHLSITLSDMKSGSILELYKCIGDLVKSNRKLQTLTIRTTIQMEIKSLLNMIEHNRTVSKLVVAAGLKTDRENDLETMQLVHEHPLLVRQCCRYQLDSSTHFVE